ncbi:hypothetical protein [Vibrio mangrovi]|uniref:Tetratricopeptide repeat protein n=1 Tax=Vibrio mangrovi TaxID=474394 RepID=A0A1Y6IYA5_9VIBR|nr:hypothetical protein [Vibrio mangrovi]MDW6005032.1 hypothetical protein [Vibrio mangrovi]SMS01800.1 hypothetical protein VIM7927_03108 [Vibrio mangrovi]
MEKSLYLLEIEIEQLKRRFEFAPADVLSEADQCLIRSRQIHFAEGIIQCLMLMCRCSLLLGKHTQGIRCAKEALAAQNELDNDEYLPEILHLHALHFWEEGKFYTAQQYWIHALEQAALEEEIDILIESLLGLGNIWRSTHEYHLACATHELAVKVANNTRQESLEGRARILWAWDLYLLNRYVDMLTVLDGALEVLEDSHFQQQLAEVWDFRALALLGLERLEDAEEAARNAHDLAVANNLSWVKAHSYVNRARLEMLRQNMVEATALLNRAEQAARDTTNDELLALVYYQQSLVAEQQQDYQAALSAFKRYRSYSTSQLKIQTNRESKDKIRNSKKQLEQRARKLINRIRGQYEYDPEKHLSNVVSETYWWEQLVLFKTALKSSNYSVVIIYHENPRYIDACTELTHSLCSKQDLVSRLSSDRLGLLLADKGDDARQVFHILQQMIKIYPWGRKGLTGKLPDISLHDILSFPFTLDQLTELPLKGS